MKVAAVEEEGGFVEEEKRELERVEWEEGGREQREEIVNKEWEGGREEQDGRNKELRDDGRAHLGGRESDHEKGEGVKKNEAAGKGENGDEREERKRDCLQSMLKLRL